MGPVVAVTMAATRSRLQSGVPPARRDELLPEHWFAAWSAATLATDPVGAQSKPPIIRVPAGVKQDSDRYWSQGKSTYDPTKIVAPTLVVVAEWDELTPPDSAKSLYESLVNSADRRFAELKEGSHMILLEKTRMSLFEAVQPFIDAPGAP
jgi:pimeloyl-ACP methyl ester carboxylesterase